MINIEAWIYRGLIAVLALFLWWQNVRIDSLEESIVAKDKAMTEARLDYEKAFNERVVKETGELKRQLDLANDLARSRGADIERLRNANARLQARAKGATQGSDREALAKCSELLTEGAGLVTEGERLLFKHGAEHDTLSGLTDVNQ